MKKFLATPGPVNIPQAVLDAMQYVCHHRSAEFAQIHQDTCTMLSQFFGSPHPSLLIASSGTGAMETSLVNLLSPNDLIICLEMGKFSERFREIALAYGCRVISISSPYGTYPSPQQLQDTLAQYPKAKLVTCCHCETSTGILAPINQYAEIIAPTDILFVVDSISSAGTCPINQAHHKIDLCLGTGNKGFMVPPGVAVLSYYGDKISQALALSSLPKYYFNLQKEITSQKKGLSLWTPPINNILGLHTSLNMMISEGIDNVYQRHQNISDYVYQRAEQLGLRSIVQKSYTRSPSLSGFFVPNPKEIIQKMDQQNIIITGGQGEFTNKIIRIGHMGNMSLDDMIWVMDSLERCLSS